MVKSQTGIAFLIVIVVVVAAFLFLYEGGYLGSLLPGNTQTVKTNAFVPISVNSTSPKSLLSLYPNQQFQVITSLANSRSSPMTVSIVPFGCSFLSTATRTISIPGDSPASLSWSFSSSSAANCAITFKVCFNDTAYADYPVTLMNYQFTGTPPTSAPSFSSGRPISLYLEGINNSIVAPPSTVNDTEYINSEQLSSYGTTGGLKWVDVNISNDYAYFTLYTGVVEKVDNINLTSSNYELAFQSGNLLSPMPFKLEIPPVAGSLGYSNDISINVSTAYTYCVSSNSLPVSVT